MNKVNQTLIIKRFAKLIENINYISSALPRDKFEKIIDKLDKNAALLFKISDYLKSDYSIINEVTIKSIIIEIKELLTTIEKIIKNDSEVSKLINFNLIKETINDSTFLLSCLSERKQTRTVNIKPIFRAEIGPMVRAGLGGVLGPFYSVLPATTTAASLAAPFFEGLFRRRTEPESKILSSRRGPLETKTISFRERTVSGELFDFFNKQAFHAKWTREVFLLLERIAKYPSGIKPEGFKSITDSLKDLGLSVLGLSTLFKSLKNISKPLLAAIGLSSTLFRRLTSSLKHVLTGLGLSAGKLFQIGSLLAASYFTYTQIHKMLSEWGKLEVARKEEKKAGERLEKSVEDLGKKIEERIKAGEEPEQLAKKFGYANFRQLVIEQVSRKQAAEQAKKFGRPWYERGPEGALSMAGPGPAGPLGTSGVIDLSAGVRRSIEKEQAIPFYQQVEILERKYKNEPLPFFFIPERGQTIEKANEIISLMGEHAIEWKKSNMSQTHPFPTVQPRNINDSADILIDEFTRGRLTK